MRKWFGHDAKKCFEFKKRYFKELTEKKELVASIREKLKKADVAFLYGAKEESCNNAIALKEYLER